MVTSRGEARKIEEYVPIATPIMSANEKNFVVSPPKKNIDPNTIKTVREVFIDLVIV